MPNLWVIEIREGKKWRPTVGVSMTVPDARLEMRLWKLKNPDDRFRLRRYRAIGRVK